MNEHIMRALGFGDLVDLVKLKKCPFCNNDIDESLFRDELSFKEYKITGLCQSCQDMQFKG